MGALFSLCKCRNRRAKILMLGLDGAGKTTITYRLKLNETITAFPTCGFNVEELPPVNHVTFTIWDGSVNSMLRPLLVKNNAPGTDGLIFVVDSADRERFPEAKSDLYRILDAPEMQEGVHVVVIANKQDLPGAVCPDILAFNLGLLEETKYPWRVWSACAVRGKGILEALEVLAEMVKFPRKDYNPYRNSNKLL